MKHYSLFAVASAVMLGAGCSRTPPTPAGTSAEPPTPTEATQAVALVPMPTTQEGFAALKESMMQAKAAMTLKEMVDADPDNGSDAGKKYYVKRMTVDAYAVNGWSYDLTMMDYATRIKSGQIMGSELLVLHGTLWVKADG